jgi:DNA-binding MarR family transcriptional regulator
VAEGNQVVSESAVRAARELRTVFSRLRRRLKETFETEGLTPSQTSALSRLSKDGPASASDLAAVEGVRHQSMAATLAVLAERGLIVRRPDPTDGRRQLVSVSRKGTAYVDDRRRAGKEWLAQALQTSFTERERQQILHTMALLDRLVES